MTCFRYVTPVHYNFTASLGELRGNRDNGLAGHRRLRGLCHNTKGGIDRDSLGMDLGLSTRGIPCVGHIEVCISIFIDVSKSDIVHYVRHEGFLVHRSKIWGDRCVGGLLKILKPIVDIRHC
jgi:hypothetical protein